MPAEDICQITRLIDSDSFAPARDVSEKNTIALTFRVYPHSSLISPFAISHLTLAHAHASIPPYESSHTEIKR